MTRAHSVALLVAAAVLTAAIGAQACVPAMQGEAVRIVRSATHAVAWRAEPRSIPVGAHFVVELAACAVDGSAAIAGLAVDADMPQHRHGMNYRATVAAQGDGRYRAEGLMFHMPGRWRLTVELRVAGGIERLTDEFVVE